VRTDVHEFSGDWARSRLGRAPAGGASVGPVRPIFSRTVHRQPAHGGQGRREHSRGISIPSNQENETLRQESLPKQIMALASTLLERANLGVGGSFREELCRKPYPPGAKPRESRRSAWFSGSRMIRGKAKRRSVANLAFIPRAGAQDPRTIPSVLAHRQQGGKKNRRKTQLSRP